MATTSNYPGAIDSLPSPPATLAGPPTHEDVHLQLADAIEKIETEIGINAGDRMSMDYATTVARDAAIASPVEGNICYLEDVGLQAYDGSNWWTFPLTQRGISTSTSSAGGVVTVTFGKTFPSAPTVVFSFLTGIDDPSTGVLTAAATTTGFTVTAYGPDNLVRASKSVTLNWIATV